MFGVHECVCTMEHDSYDVGRGGAGIHKYWFSHCHVVPRGRNVLFTYNIDIQILFTMIIDCIPQKREKANKNKRKSKKKQRKKAALKSEKEKVQLGLG